MQSSKEMMRDPERMFTDPNRLVESTELSDHEKLTLLESWQADLLELQRATEENMASANVSPGTNAAKLARITEAIARIRERVGQQA